MGQFSAEKPVPPGSTFSGNQHSISLQGNPMPTETPAQYAARVASNAAKTNGNGKLDAFVRANLLEVWDSIERVTA